MIIAAWFLGAHVIRSSDTQKKHLAIVACLLIAPTLLMSIFGGIGVPPGTLQEWVATATEQQIRFSFLIISGIFMGFGLIILREKLKETEGNLYSQPVFAAIIIALPILIFNISFWHDLAMETYKIKINSVLEKMPEWFLQL